VFSGNEGGDGAIAVTVTAVSCVAPPRELRRNMERIVLEGGGDDEGAGDDGGHSSDESVRNVPQALLPEVLFGDTSCFSNNKKFFPFGTPCKEHFDIWTSLNASTGVLFDLLYAPKAFQQIFQAWENEDTLGDCGNDDNTVCIYLHCGGTEGNTSQFNRYKYLKLIDRDEKLCNYYK
jgi:hypothetical protein